MGFTYPAALISFAAHSIIAWEINVFFFEIVFLGDDG